MLHRSFDDRCPLHGREAPAGLAQEWGETTFSQVFDRDAFRAATLKEAADRAEAWYRSGQIIPVHGNTRFGAIKELRAAIEGVQK